ncbi:MAG TPA: N-acetylmuramic acid 6-phosphate etherase [Solirubrobacteraceae bacterium]|nr:N-acetylmuramic acid 6-phosphate etherase [Solirubrobacteraceae bacterium]
MITEGHDASLADLDLRATPEVVRSLNDANAVVLDALREAEGAIAALVDAAAGRGRVVYVGAGSAGAMAAADAAEWGPTFSVPDDAVVALVAGAELPAGPRREAAEDDAAAGAAELRALGPLPDDVVVAVSASGSTPYALGALRAAADVSALTAAVVCVPDSPLAREAEHSIVLAVGPEVIAGSTRLKAGTAQKLALNAFSTALMVRRGRTYGNLMSSMRVANAKLRDRAVRICCAGAGCDAEAARAALASADDELEVALVMLLADVDAGEARARLSAAGSIREAAR